MDRLPPSARGCLAAGDEPPPSAAAHFGECFRLACWFGLLAGIFEVVGRWALWQFLHKLPLGLTHPHVAWMAVVSDVALYAALGGLFGALAWSLRRPVPLGLAAAAYAVLFYFCLGDVLEVQSRLALATLLLGLAAAAARSEHRLARLAQRTLRPLAFLTALLAGIFYGYPTWAEHCVVAALPPARAGAPNLLLITLDTVRADHLSLYGYSRKTAPRLEEYARRGVAFDGAIATTSWTLPSHASMFTGHFPSEIFHGTMRVFHNAWEKPMDAALPTLAEYLDQHGYRTGGFVANWTFCDRLYGLARGFADYQEYNLGLEQIIKSAYFPRILGTWVGERLDPRMDLARSDGLTVNRQFLDWLAGVKGRPFFAFLNYMDSHDPYHPPLPFAGRFATHGERPEESADGERTPAQVAADGDDYDCCLAALDDYVGELLDELDRRGILDQTVTIITGDHGEHFGEHSYFSHGQTLYMPVIHVPLLVLSPQRVPAGVRVRGPASLRDLPATIVDLLDIVDGSPFPGTSLRGRWDERQLPAQPAYSNLDMMVIDKRTRKPTGLQLRSVVGERYHYMEGIGVPVCELYDLENDPDENYNLADRASEAAILKRLRDEMERAEAQ
jgi:arylsulfatase A-like enzyme